MRITEAQLRRIIREEARRVLEGQGAPLRTVVHQGKVYRAKSDGSPDLDDDLGFYDEWTGADPVTPDDDDLYGARNIKSVPA